MGYVTVAQTADVPEGTAKAVMVGDREIAICNADGRICAIDNVCTHDYGMLDEGVLEGFEIECPLHGARFDIRTGEATAAPAFMPVDTYPVRVEGEEIQVDV